MGNLIKVADGFHFLEGPRWHENKLWFSDMHGYKVHNLDAAGNLSPLAEIPEARTAPSDTACQDLTESKDVQERGCGDSGEGSHSRVSFNVFAGFLHSESCCPVTVVDPGVVLLQQIERYLEVVEVGVVIRWWWWW